MEILKSMKIKKRANSHDKRTVRNIDVLDDTKTLAEDKKEKEQTLLCDLNIQAVPANSCVQRKDTNRLLIVFTFCPAESREINYSGGSFWIIFATSWEKLYVCYSQYNKRNFKNM